MPHPADLFRRAADLDAFREGVAALGGDFPFAAADMIALGEAYFDRHPERSVGRNPASVLLGYALVRVCVAEKAVRGLSPEGRAFYRAVFQDVAQVGPRLDVRLAAEGRAALRTEATAVREALDAEKRTMEEIPRGMIRERFIGGISNLYNILYVIGLKLGPE